MDTTGDTNLSLFDDCLITRSINALGLKNPDSYEIYMKQGIWLSFDLGVKGDYESLYKWLDARNAFECGDSIAFLDFEYETNIVTEVSNSLHSSIKMDPANRFYLIAKGPDDKDITGRFIIGARKAPPWTGYGPPKGVPKPDAP
ncbi:MAG: hypothetical protein DME43_01430 [Verrucomicrobia bacterium]|nr:MAG: hypothetical protein DME43_01430 [Verrucomicrobiota bacterium]PYK72640.1 MAG: hypothetical protein DME44_03940 [Verrucomicrobiota bacterium]